MIPSPWVGIVLAPEPKSGQTIEFEQRSLLRPWRVERIVEVWTGRRWLVHSRTKMQGDR